MAIKLSQKEISLDLQHQGFTNTIYVQEGDVESRELTISLFDDGEEYNISSSSKVYLSGERSDKAVVSREVDSFTNNIIKVVFRNEEICAKGISKYKIIIKDADDVLSSVYFKVKVYENVYDENGILATPQYSELQEAIKKANSSMDEFHNKLDEHYFVLTEDKDIAGGVPSLDVNAKVPISELYGATTSNKGVTQLTDSVTSDSTTTAATPNSVKSVKDSLNSEISRATSAENTLATNLNSEISRAKSAEKTNSNAISSETTRAKAKENEITNNLSSEITRAKNAENTLSTNKLDKTTVATSSTLGLVKSGTDITVDTSGNVSVNDNSHKHTVSNISDLTATASELNVLDGITATTTELNYTDGVTSNIQTQLNSKSANGHTHDDRYYTESEIDTTVSDINDSITSHIGNTSNPHSVTKAQVGLGNVENKSSATIRGEITKSNVTTALGYTPYTPNEIDNKFSALETNIDWKESVATFDDIATTYPNPVDGWTVNVKDTDYTYRYNGTLWVAISANAIPKATNSVDGLLSKEDHANYDDANSKKHTHSNKSVIDGISSTNVSNWNAAKTHADSAHARTNATKVEKSSTNGNIKINGTETTVYTHPGGTNPHGTTKSDVGLGNVGNFKAVSTVANQGLTDTEKSNARTNIGAGTSSFSGSYNDLSNKPTLGTASSKDVALSGNASALQVVMGNDTRLADSRKASDVYAWAKASTKPSYTASEIGLGNVPNVATNDQTPSYTEATTLAKLASGEKLSVAFGKISKAITDLISHIGDSVKHITSSERTNWNAAKTHADSAHAPSNAQANVIETVKVNGTTLTPSSKAVNIAVPTNNNQLTNGAGYITSSGTAKTISDTLPISKGGTGKTTGVDAANTLINSLSTGDSTPTDADYYISQYVGGGTTRTTYHRRPMSALWNYIKSKLSTVATSGSYNDLSNKPTIPTKVGELTNDKDYATKNEVAEAIDDIEIGGRNLLLNSADLTKWTPERDVTVKADTDGYFKISTTRNSDWWTIEQDITLDAGSYTVSGYFKAGSKKGTFLIRRFDNYVRIVEKLDVLGYFKHSFTISETTKVRVNIGLNPTASGDYVYAKLFKLEKGNKATDWTPAIEDTEAEIQAVDNKLTTNLLKPTLGTVTQNGVTCTDNGDGTYTLNGTASANTEFTLYMASNLVELNKEFRLIGCPNNTNAYLVVSDGGNPWTVYGADRGNGSNFKITTSSPDKRVLIVVPKGATVDNIVFKPMITTNLNATYDDFVPYTGDTGKLNSDVAEVRKDFDEHTHTKSQITDFPTSLPASDVYPWAKESSKPSYSWDEIGSKPSYADQLSLSGNTLCSKHSLGSSDGYISGLDFYKGSFYGVGASNISTNHIDVTNGVNSNSIYVSDDLTVNSNGTIKLGDHYVYAEEKGTWEGKLEATGTTVATSTGLYRKIGDMVYVQIEFTSTSDTTSSILSGLPFAIGQICAPIYGTTLVYQTNSNSSAKPLVLYSTKSTSVAFNSTTVKGRVYVYGWYQAV